MPCMDSSGGLTERAKKMLAAMARPAALSEVAGKTGIPLYRVRSAGREVVDAGLVTEQKDGAYVLAEAGRAAVSRAPGKV